MTALLLRLLGTAGVIALIARSHARPTRAAYGHRGSPVWFGRLVPSAFEPCELVLRKWSSIRSSRNASVCSALAGSTARVGTFSFCAFV